MPIQGSQLIIVVKVILFVIMALCFVGIAYMIRQKRVIHKALSEAYSALDTAAVKRAGSEKREIFMRQWAEQEEGTVRRLLQKPESRYRYSRLFVKTGLAFEVWFILKIASAAVIYFVLVMLSHSPLLALLGAAVYLLLFAAFEEGLAYRNYKVVDDNLLQFVNLLSNFSLMSGEITGVFHKAAAYLPDPLSSILEECYYDAQTSGDTAVALYVLADKVNHPVFKDLIRNIEVCANYTADFSVIMTNSRKVIRNARRAQKERKSMARENLVEMVIISIALVVAMGLVNMLVGVSVFDILFHTTVGHIALILIAVCYTVFAVSVFKAGR